MLVVTQKLWAVLVQAKEGDIPLQRFRNYSCLLKLKALLLEAGCYMYLTSSHYKRARASMISLLDLHARFPETMQCLRASTHMLAGEVMPFATTHMFLMIRVWFPPARSSFSVHVSVVG